MRKALVICFLSCLQLHADPANITVAGTGVTGLWTAYTICKDLEQAGFGEDVTVTVVGKWDWLAALKEAASQKTSVFSHESSGLGPMGIQPHSGLLWNTDNEVVDLVRKGVGRPEASFYTSSELEEEGKEFLELYVGWHSRHPDTSDPSSSFQRQRALIAINRYARGLWGDFHRENHLGNDNRFFLNLEGAWRLYDDPVHFENALKSLAILDRFHYGAEAVTDSDEIAARVPFYRKIISDDRKRGIFFHDDGIVDSNEVRKFLWAFLTEERKGKPQVKILLNREVVRLSIDPQGICRGVILDSEEEVPSDIAVLAMGLGNKKVLARHDIELPMWNIWGASVRAALKDKTGEAPRGGVSFHTQRCFTGVPGGRFIIVAGTSMVIPAKEVPSPALYEEKLRKSLQAISQGRIDETSLAFRVAPRPGIADDLPVIDLQTEMQGLIILNPTSHLGVTQSIGLGKLASLHVLEKLGAFAETPASLYLHEYRLDRFQDDIKHIKIGSRLLDPANPNL